MDVDVEQYNFNVISRYQSYFLYLYCIEFTSMFFGYGMYVVCMEFEENFLEQKEKFSIDFRYFTYQFSGVR